jgi:hypothetical protein
MINGALTSLRYYFSMSYRIRTPESSHLYAPLFTQGRPYVVVTFIGDAPAGFQQILNSSFLDEALHRGYKKIFCDCTLKDYDLYQASSYGQITHHDFVEKITALYAAHLEPLRATEIINFHIQRRNMMMQADILGIEITLFESLAHTHKLTAQVARRVQTVCGDEKAIIIQNLPKDFSDAWPSIYLDAVDLILCDDQTLTETMVKLCPRVRVSDETVAVRQRDQAKFFAPLGRSLDAMGEHMPLYQIETSSADPRLQLVH